MQNSNPFQNPHAVPFPFCLDEAMTRAYARAREVCGGAAPSTSDVLAAHATIVAEGAGTQTDAAPEASATPDRLDVGELLGVLREPIEWIFTLAERRAHGDAIDVAAIHRVRDAVRARIASMINGDGAAANALRVRAPDLLTVASLLIGTLDPAVVQRAALSLGNLGSGFADAFMAMLRLDPSAVSHAPPSAMPFMGASFMGARVPRSAVPSCTCDDNLRSAAPFAGPCIPRAVAPTWCCAHGHFTL